MVLSNICKYGIYADSPEQFAAYTLRYGLLMLVLIYASVSDIRYKRIPNLCVAAVALLSLLRLFDHPGMRTLVSGCMPAVLIYVSLLMIEGVKGRKLIGRGDIKLLAVLGLHYDFVEMLYIVLISCIIAIVIFLIIIRDRRRGIALCPMITTAVLIITLVR